MEAGARLRTAGWRTCVLCYAKILVGGHPRESLRARGFAEWRDLALVRHGPRRGRRLTSTAPGRETPAREPSIPMTSLLLSSQPFEDPRFTGRPLRLVARRPRAPGEAQVPAQGLVIQPVNPAGKLDGRGSAVVKQKTLVPAPEP